MRTSVLRALTCLALGVLLASGPIAGQTCQSSTLCCPDCRQENCWAGGPCMSYIGESYDYISCNCIYGSTCTDEDCEVTCLVQVQGVCPDGSTWWTTGQICCF